jgi:hypothetical protein
MPCVPALQHNDQLTDGGPSVTSELPLGVAGPPFGAASGSATLCSCVLSGDVAATTAQTTQIMAAINAPSTRRPMIAESHLGGRKLASMPTTAMLGMRTTVQRLQSKPAFAENRRYRLAFDAFICASWSGEAERQRCATATPPEPARHTGNRPPLTARQSSRRRRVAVGSTDLLGDFMTRQSWSIMSCAVNIRTLYLIRRSSRDSRSSFMAFCKAATLSGSISASPRKVMCLPSMSKVRSTSVAPTGWNETSY